MAAGDADTIAALATAPGKAAVAVVRLSGPRTVEILQALGARAGAPRRARLATLKDREGRALDRALVLWFPAPASFTGEDVAELHLHGGRFVTEATLARLMELGARPARPGEFTRRAFENGKLDLTQAEAVADLIDAESLAQARQANAQLEGALGERHRAWRARLIALLARLEALVDFPEDETAEAEEGVALGLADLAGELAIAVSDAGRGRRVREGFKIAVAGLPNAGKSSLFNALVGRDAAIVTAVPGTTRDVLEAALDVAGYRVRLADTAGLRDSDDLVEREGVRRARAAAEAADRRIWVVDGAADATAEAADWRAGDLCVINKADRPRGEAGRLAVAAAAAGGLAVLELSVLAEGPERVLAWIEAAVVQAAAGEDFPAVTRARHAAALGEALAAVERARGRLAQPELAAEDVRLAARALAAIVGAVAPEDVLGEVFATFCIGK